MTPRRPPLQGLVVLDLTRVLAGPLATMVLADLGARVVKVESPRGGDVTRSWAPPRFDGEASYFLAVNRRKESVVADLDTPDGAELVRRWARRADVVVENFLPGSLTSRGLSVESLREANPRLVVCTISGYGHVGPRAGEPGFDLLAQAASGLMSITGSLDGEPSKVGVAMVDVLTGWAAVTAILAALQARVRDGVGAHVRTDLFSTSLFSLVNVAQAALVTGLPASRHGNAHPSLEPYRPFAAKDGWLILAVGSDRQFALLCERVIGRPDLAVDPRFSTNEARVAHRDALVALLNDVLAGDARDRWLTLCREAGVPAGEIAGVRDALLSPQAAALGSVLTLSREGHAEVPGVRSPLFFDGFEEPPPLAPPRLDEDGERLFREVGLTRDHPFE